MSELTNPIPNAVMSFLSNSAPGASGILEARAYACALGRDHVHRQKHQNFLDSCKQNLIATGYLRPPATTAADFVNYEPVDSAGRELREMNQVGPYGWTSDELAYFIGESAFQIRIMNDLGVKRPWCRAETFANPPRTFSHEVYSFLYGYTGCLGIGAELIDHLVFAADEHAVTANAELGLMARACQKIWHTQEEPDIERLVAHGWGGPDVSSRDVIRLLARPTTRALVADRAFGRSAGWYFTRLGSFNASKSNHLWAPGSTPAPTEAEPAPEPDRMARARIFVQEVLRRTTPMTINEILDDIDVIEEDGPEEDPDYFTTYVKEVLGKLNIPLESLAESTHPAVVQYQKTYGHKPWFVSACWDARGYVHVVYDPIKLGYTPGSQKFGDKNEYEARFFRKE